jgi:hypothetical protein
MKEYVYHLYHAHNTYRDPRRHTVLKKLMKYTKQDWIKHINSINWGKFITNTTISEPKQDIQVLSDFKYYTEPILSICIVNYRRFNTLIRTLKKYTEFGININLFLWINDSSFFSKEQHKKIESICSKLYHHEIIKNEDNVGTGKSRHMLLSLAYESGTPYIMTTDDDMLYNNEDELLIGPSFLQSNDDYDAIGIWCEPITCAHYIVGDEILNFKPKKGLQEVDVLGAATMTMRRSVISDCLTDERMVVSLVDIDFSLCLKNNGHKMCLLCDDRWKPTNINDLSDTIYKNERYSIKYRKISENILMKKWGLVYKWRNFNTLEEYNG